MAIIDKEQIYQFSFSDDEWYRYDQSQYSWDKISIPDWLSYEIKPPDDYYSPYLLTLTGTPSVENYGENSISLSLSDGMGGLGEYDVDFNVIHDIGGFTDGMGGPKRENTKTLIQDQEFLGDFWSVLDKDWIKVDTSTTDLTEINLNLESLDTENYGVRIAAASFQKDTSIGMGTEFFDISKTGTIRFQHQDFNEKGMDLFLSLSPLNKGTDDDNRPVGSYLINQNAQFHAPELVNLQNDNAYLGINYQNYLSINDLDENDLFEIEIIGPEWLTYDL